MVVQCDNCFCDEALRIKVGDFGTSVFASKLQATATGTTHADDTASVQARPPLPTGDRTVTSGGGSLLWSAPEALLGRRIPEAETPALDVYSFAVVLFEIWTRSEPWREISTAGIEFWSELQVSVTSGVRPQPPPGCEPAPTGYCELMDACWRTESRERLSFAEIVPKIRDFQANA
jgi:hypothetical protein